MTSSNQAGIDRPCGTHFGADFRRACMAKNDHRADDRRRLRDEQARHDYLFIGRKRP